jgi:hypothetical protein
MSGKEFLGAVRIRLIDFVRRISFGRNKYMFDSLCQGEQFSDLSAQCGIISYQNRPDCLWAPPISYSDTNKFLALGLKQPDLAVQ